MNYCWHPPQPPDLFQLFRPKAQDWSARGEGMGAWGGAVDCWDKVAKVK